MSGSGEPPPPGSPPAGEHPLAETARADRRRAASPAERTFLGLSEVETPPTVAALAELVRECSSSGTPIAPAGAGAHAYEVDPVSDGTRVVSSAELGGVAIYEPDDFTIGVGAGMPLGELRETLHEHGQEVAVDFPTAGSGTAGGLVARAPSGPRRGAYGPISTQLLGVEGVTGAGKRFRAGGMVVKNVAGYQLGKLLAGANGRGGFLTRVNFKLRPLPAARRLVLVAFADSPGAWSLAAAVRHARLEPAVLEVLAGEAPSDLAAAGLPDAAAPWVVAALFEGDPGTVLWQAGELRARAGGEHAGETHDLGEDEAAAYLEHRIRTCEPAEFPGNRGIVRLSVLPTELPALESAARDLLREQGFTGALWADAATGLLTIRWSGATERVDEPVGGLRDLAVARGGAARLVALPPAVRRAWSAFLTEDPNAALASRILRAFDPDGTFERARERKLREPGSEPGARSGGLPG